MRTHSLFLLIAVALLPGRSEALTLDQTSVGRFGSGRAVRANTASQDLLSWHVRNTGRGLEIGSYDERAKLVNLGECGLPVEEGEEIANTVRDISWTGLTSRYQAGGVFLEARESLLTPVLWLRTDALRLEVLAGAAPITVAFVPVEAGVRAAAGEETVLDRLQGERMAEPWVLLLAGGEKHRVPVLLLFSREPRTIATSGRGGLVVDWDGNGERFLGLMPLYGCRPDTMQLTAGWERGLPAEAQQRARALAARFLHVPDGLRETYEIADDAVAITDRMHFLPLTDAWGWHARGGEYALIPPALARAERYGYPATLTPRPIDLDYPTFLGPLRVVESSQVTYALPKPRLYETLNSPFYDPALDEVLPAETLRTIRNYSDWVLANYGKPRPPIYDGSAIGEARTMLTDYRNYLMMSPPARQAFEAWADRMAADRLYNRSACYNYGQEAANGRRFLIDSYRFGGDYVDAGWFGYDVGAMWARAHYGGKWHEVATNWPWISELFYGWTWTYSDYASMSDPLGFDANTGDGRYYGDNMAMLTAHYAWARMADHLGDAALLADADYMLARDIVARYSRMVSYDYARECGYRTDVTALAPSMRDGPNISPSGDFVPSDSSQWLRRAVVDYGRYEPGLWHLTGWFLEPVTSETIALMNGGTMMRRVAESQALVDRRFPRWYAAPTVGEIANYLIYLRGALLHQPAALLRSYFDYQELFGPTTWPADGWHGDAFAGIVLSSFHGLEHQDDCRVLVRDGADWTAAKDRVELNIIVGGDGRQHLALVNRTAGPLEARVEIRSGQFGLTPGASLKEAKSGRSVTAEPGGSYRVTLAPGATLLALPGPAAAPAPAASPVALPPAVARVELWTPDVTRGPGLGTAHVWIRNRQRQEEAVALRGTLGDRVIEEQSLHVGADSHLETDVPLSAEAPAGAYTLEVSLSGRSLERAAASARVLLLSPQGPSPVVLCGFEQDTQGWTMPGWPDANRSPEGDLYRPERSQEQASEGRSSLRMMLNMLEGRESTGLAGASPGMDWSLLGTVSVDVFLPETAPAGLYATLFMMGDGWRWLVQEPRVPLVPGRWTTLETHLAGPQGARAWNLPEADLQAALRNVIDFGVKVDNAGSVGYQGPIYLDNLGVTPR